MILDEYQEAARLNMDQSVLLVAPPGSGKTTVLLKKIEYLTNDQNILPGRIVVLTFSRSAAENLKERFAEKERPFFGTIHSFALRALLKEGIKGAVLDPGLEQDAVKVSRRRFLFSEKMAQGILASYSRVRAGLSREGEVPAWIYHTFCEEYEAYRQRNHQWDFDDLQEIFLKKLQKDDYATKLRQTFDWILVDEFQDLNQIQLQILQHLSCGKHLFCVGDEDQCIYAFRGSDTRGMVDFPSRFQGKVLYLVYNYRSVQSVVDYANRIICHNKVRYGKEILNHRKEPGQTTFLRLRDEEEEFQEILRILRRKRAAQGKAQQVAMIFRTNFSLKDYGARLYQEGIFFRQLTQHYHPWQEEEIVALLNVLRYLENPNMNDFIHLLRDLRLPLEQAVLLPLEEGRHIEKKKSIKECFQVLREQSKSSLSSNQMELLKKVERTLIKAQGQTPIVVCGFFLYELGYEEILRKNPGHHKKATSVQDFCDKIGLCPNYQAVINVGEALGEAIKAKEEGSNLLLATMHGVKGMEFSHVLLPDVVQGNIPHHRSFKDLEAERRLFYVAVTRARDELTLFCPKFYFGQKKEASIFLKETPVPFLTPEKKGWSQVQKVLASKFEKAKRLFEKNNGKNRGEGETGRDGPGSKKVPGRGRTGSNQRKIKGGNPVERGM